MGIGYPNAEYLLATIGYMPQKLMQIVAMLLVLVYFFFNSASKVKAIKPNFIWAFFIAVCLFSILFSPSISSTLRYFLSVFFISIPLYLYFKEYGGEALYKVVYKFIFFSLVVNFAYTILLPQYGVMTANHHGAWRGLFVHKNVFGGFISLAGIFLFYEAFMTAGRKKIAVLGFFACFLMAVMSKSTTALITFLAVIPTLLFVQFLLALDDKNKKAIFLFIYTVLLVLVYFTVNSFIDEIFILLDKDPTLTGRTGLWDVLLELSAQRPAIGYGLGYFHRPEVMYKYSVDFGWDAKSTHSSYIDMILGVGYLGTIIFSTILVKLLLNTLMKRKPVDSGVDRRAVSVTVVVGCLFVGSATSGVILGTSFFWLLMLAMMIYMSETKTE
ncbi:O-antigen ligase family protein [Corallincola luteus]|nr:O-antigen ligase family protein [Corallincola luteus]